MVASNQIFLVMDAGTPVAAFTARQELKAYLRRRLDVFIKPAGLHVLGQSRDAEHHDCRRWQNHAWSVEGRRGPQSASPLRGSCSIHSG